MYPSGLENCSYLEKKTTMITEMLFFPALVLFVGAAILSVIPDKYRSSAFIVFPALALFAVFSMPDGYSLTLPFASYELTPVNVDALSRVFGIIFAFIAIVGGVYAFHIQDKTQQLSALIYAGGALGVTFAGDWFTLFVFWEIMAVSSTYLIWARKESDSDTVGLRYLLVHIFGGGLLFSGILMHIAETGNVAITALPDVYTLSSVLMLLGVALNSAIPPLHAWLADAYPRATVTGAVFMSAFTTKSAVYVLIRVFPGWDILLWFGVAMALYGVVYAVLANDIRQILAYHIVSQVGYMVAGVGLGTEMALNGTAAHAFSHILYKSLLFMGAGAVLYSTGKSKLTELGGFASKMKVVVFLYMIGAFSISGFPFFNGFISKSMIVSAMGNAHAETAMLLLILASVGTFLHTGLKLPYFTWFGQAQSEITVKPVPKNMVVAMGIGAFFCTLFGVYPDLLYRYLPYANDYQPYTIYHFVEMIQILVFTFVGFWLLRGKLSGDPYLALDTDWFYRKPAKLVKRIFVFGVDKTFDKAEETVLNTRVAVSKSFVNPMQWLNPFSYSSNQAKTYSSGIEVILAFILMVFVVISLVYFLI
jgi:multicomponent Na+:H+ antiporter subunit D